MTIYSGQGLEAPGYVIDAVLGTKIAKRSNDQIGENRLWWGNQTGPKKKHTFFIYTEEKRLARKIEKVEKVSPAIYRRRAQKGYEISAWQYCFKYKSLRHLNKLLSWCGLEPVPLNERSDKQIEALEKGRRAKTNSQLIPVYDDVPTSLEDELDLLGMSRGLMTSGV